MAVGAGRYSEVMAWVETASCHTTASASRSAAPLRLSHPSEKRRRGSRTRCALALAVTIGSAERHVRRVAELQVVRELLRGDLVARTVQGDRHLRGDACRLPCQDQNAVAQV